MEPKPDGEERKQRLERQLKKPKETTLGEYGPQLPCGTVDPVSGKLIKAIDFRSWNLRREKQLGKLKTSSAADSVMKFTTTVLTVMCSQLGGLKPDPVSGMRPKEFAKLRLQTAALFLMDVLYAYVYLRREVMGPELVFNAQCPSCRQPAAVSADLDTTTVSYVDDIAETYWTYKLIDSIKVRGKEIAHLKMGPPRWSVLENTDASGIDFGGQKADLILGSVIEAGELGQVALIETDLDDLTKRDVEGLAAELDDHLVGPDMRVEYTCEKCFSQSRIPLDWSYESFFASGRSDR